MLPNDGPCRNHPDIDGGAIGLRLNTRIL